MPKNEKDVRYSTKDPSKYFTIDREILTKTRDAAQLAILAGADPNLVRKTLAISILEGTGTPHGINRDTKQDISAKRGQEFVQKFLAEKPPISKDKQRYDVSSLPKDIQQQLILNDKASTGKLEDPIASYRKNGAGEKYSKSVDEVLNNAQEVFSNYELRSLLDSLKTKDEFLTPSLTPTIDSLK